MWRFRVLGLAILLSLAVVAAGAAAPVDAVVGIPSHGASGTIIFTDSGRTLVLTCGHAFAGIEQHWPITLDVPAPSPGKARPARIRLVALDQRSDLALIELSDG